MSLIGFVLSPISASGNLRTYLGAFAGRNSDFTAQELSAALPSPLDVIVSGDVFIFRVAETTTTIVVIDNDDSIFAVLAYSFK